LLLSLQSAADQIILSAAWPAAEVAATPHTEAFVALLSCVAADGEHGAVTAEHDSYLSLALVLA
jgi:hypothetical protein